MVPALPRISRSRQFIRCALTLFLFSGGSLSLFAAGEGAFEPPQPLPSERYSAIWERAPFQLKTVAVAAVNTRSFAENLALAGLSDVEGQITVYLKDKSSGAYVKLTNETPSDSGIAFDKIVEDPDPRQVKVSLRKGTETALVGYSQEQVTPGTAGGPGVPGSAPGALGKKPTGMPPGAATPGTPAPPNSDPAAAQQKIRRRIILPQGAPPPQSSLLKPSAGIHASLAAQAFPFSPIS